LLLDDRPDEPGAIATLALPTRGPSAAAAAGEPATVEPVIGDPFAEDPIAAGPVSVEKVRDGA
jgi:hypothetical protein